MNEAALGSAVFGGSLSVAARPASASGLAVHAPLAGLAGTDLSRRFCYWRGSSGRRYLFSVFPLGQGRCADRCPRFEQAVVVAVAHRRDGDRQILFIGETGRHPDLFFEGGRLHRAIAAGANEIHVHLLAEDVRARAAIVRDLQT